MKNYLQEKGSIEDFLKFSNDKKEALVKQLEEERKKMKGKFHYMLMLVVFLCHVLSY